MAHFPVDALRWWQAHWATKAGDGVGGVIVLLAVSFCLMPAAGTNKPMQVCIILMPAVGAGYIDGVIGHRSYFFVVPWKIWLYIIDSSSPFVAVRMDAFKAETIPSFREPIEFQVFASLSHR